MKFDVAIITVNYNSSAQTLNCVQSIKETQPKNLEIQIVVVDNNSELEDYLNLQCLRNFKCITLVRNKTNSGFASGNMLGVHFADAPYYFFLNNDCILKPGCIDKLKNFADIEKNGGLFSPQLVDESDNPIPSFDYFPELMSKFLGRGIFRFTRGRDFKSRKVVPQAPIKVDVLSGSQLFVRASAFHEVGGFDTNFFLYCEEEDLALRMKAAGYDRYLVPDARNYHLGGASTLRSDAIRREFLISFIYLYQKHYGLIGAQVIKLILALRYFKKALSAPSDIKLVFFILQGAPMSRSLRHEQRMVSLEPDHKGRCNHA